MFRLSFWGVRLAAAVWRRLSMWFVTRFHRASLAKVGPGSRFQSGIRFDRPSAVEIGADCYFWRGVGASAEGHDAFLKIGDRVQVNQNVLLDTTGGLTLGDDVLISEEAVIYTHDHGLDPHTLASLCPKLIEHGVWIGMRAVILPSCRLIGAGAVIGAGAIVTRDVPAGAIVGGNPARIISFRNQTEVAA